MIWRKFLWVVLASVLLGLSSLTANAKVHCDDTMAIAKEAVEYSLLGAWMPYADHSCFKGTRFKYFRPELASPEGEVTDWTKFIWFKKGSDSYKILSVKKNRDEKFAIKVRFLINGKSLETTFVYSPDSDYAKKTGICGFVTNEMHQIVRPDCTDKKVIPTTVKF